MLASGGHTDRLHAFERHPDGGGRGVAAEAEADQRSGEVGAKSPASRVAAAFLRIPPFPGSNPPPFARRISAQSAATASEIDAAIAGCASARVGGSYWGSRPQLPDEPYALVRVADREERGRQLKNAAPTPTLVWLHSGSEYPHLPADRVCPITGVLDPWHLLSGASEAIVDSDDELALVAAISGVPVQCVGSGRFAALARTPSASKLRQIFKEH